MGLRETKAEKTRKRILSDALQLFGRDGYEQTTMEAIAEAAEISPQTLYRYFPSKDLILLGPLVGNHDFSVAFSRLAVNLPVEEALAKAILEWAKWQAKCGGNTAGSLAHRSSLNCRVQGCGILFSIKYWL